MVETRHASKHPTMHSPTSTAKDYLGQPTNKPMQSVIFEKGVRNMHWGKQKVYSASGVGEAGQLHVNH